MGHCKRVLAALFQEYIAMCAGGTGENCNAATAQNSVMNWTLSDLQLFGLNRFKQVLVR